MGRLGDFMARSGAAGSNPRLHPQASLPSPRSETKQTQKLRVYNRSAKSSLSLEVAIFDTTTVSLKKLFDYLAAPAGTGLWLTPYRGIPSVQGVHLFDLVYLDEDCRVIQEVESYPSPEVNPQEVLPASVLLLPAHSVFVSQIQPGDRLAIRESDEMERRLELHPRSIGDGPVAKSTKSRAEERPDKNACAPSLTEDRGGQLHLAIQQLGGGAAESQRQKKDSLAVRLLRWLLHDSSGRRGSSRHPLPGLIAYHWSGGTPQAYYLGDISETGFYLLTEERPYLGTLIMMSLQRTDTDGENRGDSIAVYTKVVRWGPDGVGFAFVVPESAATMRSDREPNNWADQQSLKDFLIGLNLLE